MDKLKFIGSLDEEQSENAVKVAQMAKKAGVDPTLAIAIAFKESGLRTNPPRGASGEIGMMQVMPSTGKGLGYDEKKLSIPNQNIKAGNRLNRQINKRQHKNGVKMGRDKLVRTSLFTKESTTCVCCTDMARASPINGSEAEPFGHIWSESG